MKRASQRHLPVHVNQVSVTALLDLVLILLLVTLVSVPLLRRPKAEPLIAIPPVTDVAKSASPKNQIELKIEPDQSIILAGKKVTGDHLLTALKGLLAAQPESGVLVKMPANFAAGSLARLMEEMHRAGVKQTAVEVIESGKP